MRVENQGVGLCTHLADSCASVIYGPSPCATRVTSVGTPNPVRVSTRRRGAPPASGAVNTSPFTVPSWSATKWTAACSEFTKHTRPSPPIDANATFGSTEPGAKLTFDTTGATATSDATNAP